MRLAIICAVLALGCKGKPAAEGSGGSAARPEVDWGKCEAALKKAKGLPTFARDQVIIDGCRVCGDPTPLLRWSTPAESGGPKRAAIEQAVAACDAFCDPNAKQRFFGTLDNARGTSSHVPWRNLGEICKDKVSAVPDTRLASAPLLLLDRIGRAIAGRGGETASLIADLDIAVPAVTLSSVGPALPNVDGALATPAAHQISILGDDLFVGELPHARLGATGVAVTGEYPGKAATLEQLGTSFEGKAVILAPLATPAKRVVELVAAVGDGRLYLGADAPGAPDDWVLPGMIDVALKSGGANPIIVTPDMTVQNLATELAKYAARHEPALGLVAR